MELLLLICAIWALWALLAHWKKGGGRGRNHGRQNSATNADDEERRKRIELKKQLFLTRRAEVLFALREGKLNQGQIAQVLQAASLYKFSPEEVAELERALRPARRETSGSQRCRVCGNPSLPGEDLCYSHQSK